MPHVEIREALTFEEEVNWCILMCQLKLDKHPTDNPKDKGSQMLSGLITITSYTGIMLLYSI